MRALSLLDPSAQQLSQYMNRFLTKHMDTLADEQVQAAHEPIVETPVVVVVAAAATATATTAAAAAAATTTIVMDDEDVGVPTVIEVSDDGKSKTSEDGDLDLTLEDGDFSCCKSLEVILTKPSSPVVSIFEVERGDAAAGLVPSTVEFRADPSSRTDKLRPRRSSTPPVFQTATTATREDERQQMPKERLFCPSVWKIPQVEWNNNHRQSPKRRSRSNTALVDMLRDIPTTQYQDGQNHHHLSSSLSSSTFSLRQSSSNPSLLLSFNKHRRNKNSNCKDDYFHSQPDLTSTRPSSRRNHARGKRSVSARRYCDDDSYRFGVTTSLHETKSSWASCANTSRSSESSSFSKKLLELYSEDTIDVPSLRSTISLSQQAIIS